MATESQREAARTNTAGWTVVLQDVGPNKAAVMKVLRQTTSLGLQAVKELVDAAPAIACEGVSRTSALAIARSLHGAGATAAIDSVDLDAVLAPLIRGLRDNDWVQRLSAVRQLGEWGDARAVGPLVNALKDIETLENGAAEHVHQTWQVSPGDPGWDRRVFDDQVRHATEQYASRRVAVVQALELIGGVEAEQALIDHRARLSQG